MAAARRHEQILDLVRQRTFVDVDDLARHFGVTQQTIRRDISVLADRGLVRRYHGGACAPSTAENVDYATRQALNAGAKSRIAAAVAARVPDHASLILNLGTTTEAIARAIAGHRGLRVITNNLNIAATIGRNPANEVIVAGGVVRARDLGITGSVTIDCMRQFKVDFGIIGISAIEEDGTLRDFDYREVQVSRTILEQSRKVLLAADQSKFGRHALVRLGDVGEVDELFTDRQPDPAMLRLLSDSGVRVVVAGDDAAAAALAPWAPPESS